MHRWSVLIIFQPDATQSSLFIILQVHSARFGCQPHPSSGVHKTVTTASGTGHIFFLCRYLPPSLQRGHSLATSEGGSSTKNMTSTGGCSYSFVYSWWWLWTHRIINRLLCVVSGWTIINVNLYTISGFYEMKYGHQSHWWLQQFYKFRTNNIKRAGQKNSAIQCTRPKCCIVMNWIAHKSSISYFIVKRLGDSAISLLRFHSDCRPTGVTNEQLQAGNRS